MAFTNILCVLTSTQKSEDVFSHAMHMAAKTDAALHVLLALEALPPTANMVMESMSYMDTSQSLEEHAKHWLDKQLASWQERYPVTGEVTVGDPFGSIEEMVEKKDIDLVIKAASDDILDRLFGTDDMHLLRRCNSPVLLTHQTCPSQYKHIMIALDTNYHYTKEEVDIRKATNKRLVELGYMLARQENTAVHLVSVFDVYPTALLGDGFISVPLEALEEEAKFIQTEQERILNELAEQSRTPTPPKIHVVQGNPRNKIAEMATELNADLVVMGTVARIGFTGLLMGNTAEAVLSQLKCAVLTIKPE